MGTVEEMVWALWKKAIRDCWLHLAVSCVILLGFAWLFVWFVSQLPIGAFGMMLRWMPDVFKPMLGVPVAALALPLGQLSVLFVHAITLLVFIGWALGRGSDPITGEISRGTMDLILSLPVRRSAVLIPSAAVAAVGSVVLGGALMGGIGLGLWTCTMADAPQLGQLLPGALNLCAMTFCLTGITMLFSALGRDRWRTIALSAGFFVVSLIVKMAARLWPPNWPEGWDVAWWLYKLTFLSVFQPQELILLPDEPGVSALRYDLTLVGLGLAVYALAAALLWRRDIPAAR